jgi:hypothetical protein
MPDAETAALLRTVLNELCAGVPPFDACTRTNVASRLLEVARQGKPSIDDLREAGRVALPPTPTSPPTMWR